MVADAARALGGEVIGVIPQALVAREVAHGSLADLRIVATMHERKATMAELADGFIALPGGIGTLEELFEVWTWAHLGLHTKPCALLNVPGLLFEAHRFSRSCERARASCGPGVREMLLIAESPRDVVAAMRAFSTSVG
jgi:uncharacterized protein (TIGR00730 family)